MKTAIRTAIATAVLTLALIAPSEAQYYPRHTPEGSLLTAKEQHCRVEANYLHARAEERDAGWSLTDSLIYSRTRLQQAGIGPKDFPVFDRMTGLAYEWSVATPEAIRQGWEKGCMKRPDSAFRSSSQPRQRTQEGPRTMGTSVPKNTNRY